MNTTAASGLAKKSKDELIEEIQKLRDAQNGGIAEIGAFDEDELIAIGSPRAGEEMYLATDTGRIVYANDRFADELGYTPGDIVKMKIPDIDTSHSRAQWLHLVSNVKKSDEPLTFETQFNMNDGGTIPMEIIASAITYKGKSYILCQAKAIGTASAVVDRAEVVSIQEKGSIDAVLNTVSEGVIFVDTKGTITSTNATAARMLGITAADIIGKSYADPKWRMTDGAGSPIKISDHPVSVVLVAEEPVLNKRMGIAQPDGTAKNLFINASPLFDSAGVMTGAVYSMRYQSSIPADVRQELPPVEKKPEDGIGAIARRIAGASTAFEMERAVCDALIETGDYGVVWIGTMATEESRVEPSYSVGESADYLLKIKERADNGEFGKGPTGTAFKTKKPSVVNDVSTSPNFTPWKRQALRSNLNAFASFPILVHGKVHGVLNLAARQRNHFSEKTAGYLAGLAEFVSFGIQALRDRELNATLEERNVLNNLLVDTYMQNTSAAVAVFDARAPFLCTSSNEGFAAMLDEPYRSTGVKDSMLSDFSTSHIHKDIFDAINRALEDMEPQTQEGAEFQTLEGDIQRWNWIVFPILHGETITSLLYFAVRMTAGESSEEAHLLDNLSVPVYSVSHEKREVLYANPAAEKAFGLKMGMPSNNAIPFLADIPKAHHEAVKSGLELLSTRKQEEVTLTYEMKLRGTKKAVAYKHIIAGRYTEAGVLRGVQCVVLPVGDK